MVPLLMLLYIYIYIGCPFGGRRKIYPTSCRVYGLGFRVQDLGSRVCRWTLSFVSVSERGLPKPVCYLQEAYIYSNCPPVTVLLYPVACRLLFRASEFRV